MLHRAKRECFRRKLFKTCMLVFALFQFTFTKTAPWIYFDFAMTFLLHLACSVLQTGMNGFDIA